MVRFAGRGVSGNLAVDVRTTRQRPLALLQNEKPGALTQHETVAVARKRPGSPLRLGVPARGQDAHQNEPAQDEWSNRRVHAARNHRVNHTRLNIPVRVSDGVRRGGAAGGYDVAHPAEAETHGDFAGQRADGACGNGVDAALFLVAGVVKTVLLLRKLLAAAAGTDNNPHVAKLIARHALG